MVWLVSSALVLGLTLVAMRRRTPSTAAMAHQAPKTSEQGRFAEIQKPKYKVTALMASLDRDPE